MKQEQKKAVIIVLIGCLGISASAIFGKLTAADGVVVAFYRMFFTSLLLLPVILVKKRNELKTVGRKDLLLCMLSGLFLGFHFGSYLTSLKFTSVASSVVLVDTEVIFVAVASFFLFRERFSGKAVLGIVFALAGSIVIALSDRSSGGSDVLFGDLLALAGAVFVAVYTLIGTRQRSHLSTTVYTFIVYLSAAVTLLVLCLILKKPFTGYPATDYLCCLGMAVFCTLLGHSLFSYALGYLSPSFVSTAKLSEPVISSIAAVFLFHQIPPVLQVIGGALVLAGIVLYILNMRKDKDIPDTLPEATEISDADTAEVSEADSADAVSGADTAEASGAYAADAVSGAAEEPDKDRKERRNFERS